MVIRYDKTTFLISMVIPIEMDAAPWQTSDPNINAFAFADDADIINIPQKYYVVETMGVPTNILEAYICQVSSSADPIELDEQPTITIQITDWAGAPVAEIGINVTLSLDGGGTLANNTLTTDINGTATTTYKSGKNNWVVIQASAPSHATGGTRVGINIPTTAADQNWLETDDIKDAAITTAKLSADALIDVKSSAVKPGEWFVYQEATVRQLVDGLNIKDDTNAITTDGDYIYMNGMSGTNACIVKVNLQTYAEDAVYDYTGAGYTHNLTSTWDGLAYAGEHIWAAASGDLLKINKDMTLDRAISVDTSGGKIQGIKRISEDFIAVMLRGGGIYANRILIMSTQTGSIYGPLGHTLTDNVRQMAVYDGLFDYDDASIRWVHLIGFCDTNNSNIYINAVDYGTGPAPVAFVEWNAVLTSFGTLTGTLNGGLAFTNKNLWFSMTPSGGTTTSIVQLDMSDFWAIQGTWPTTVQTSIDQTETGAVWELLHDGKNLWAITGKVGGPTDRRFLRKFYNAPSTGTLTLIHTVDFGESFTPISMCFDGTNIHVAGNGVVA